MNKRWAGHRWAMLVVCATAISASSYAQELQNPPKLQKKLEAAAAGGARKEEGSVLQTGASIVYRLLTVNFELMPGADPAVARKKMTEEEWARCICRNKDLLQFLTDESVTVRVSLLQRSGLPERIADVTAESCAEESALSASVGGVIGGVAFAPKPSDQAVMILVHAYMQSRLHDPESAKIQCGNVSEAAWIEPTLEARRYGYFVDCKVNARNAYGGYVGYEDHWFRINGGNFEALEYLPAKNGLMAAVK